MKILITGATGSVGRSLGKRLVRDGHTLVALTRNVERAKEILPFPAQLIMWDGLSDLAPAEAFVGVQAIIHLAGDGIADARWTPARKRELQRSRIATTKSLLAGLRASKIQISTLISASATGIYPSSPEVQTESSPYGSGYLANLCQDWEQTAQTAKTFVPNLRVICLRLSLVLQKAQGFLGRLEPLFLDGLGARLGDGRQGMSFVHIEDLANIVVECLNNPSLSGPVNVCAPRPATNAEFTKIFAQRLARKPFFPVPKAALQLLYGEMASLLLADQKIVSGVLPGSLFQFPDLLSAIEDLYPPLQVGEEQFECEQWVPETIENVFSFFESEKNLEEITPDFLKFKVIRKSTEHLEPGSLIDYCLRLKGLPLRWRTRIETFEKNQSFTDSQVRGPYAKWHHVHSFESLAGGTLCRDRVTFRLPFGLLGRLGGSRWARKDIHKIFSYRRRKIAQRFY